MALPKDPAILLSFINTKLRDEFESLEELCAVLNTDAQEISAALSGLGYHYDLTSNRFL